MYFNLPAKRSRPSNLRSISPSHKRQPSKAERWKARAERLDLKRKLQLEIADVMWQQRKFSFLSILSMLGMYHLTINQMDEHSGQQIVDQLLLKLSTVYLFFIHKSYGRQCGSMDFMGCSMRMRSDIYCGWSNMHFCVLGWRSLLDHALYCSMSKEKEKSSNNFAHVSFQMLFL